ncbi:hypothetical protein LINPERHAP2_LOCUS20567, partial [Linum perenne]
MRARKVVHRARPMVWAPESATKSVRSSPCDWKLERSCEKLKNGGGRLLFAAEMLAVLPSLLPTGIWYQNCGPPSYTHVNVNIKNIET